MAQPNVTTQPEERRTKNFNEVSLGYTKKIVAEESKRCPQCADPVCMQGCPIGIDIPGFIRLLREGNVTGAYRKIKEKNPLPSICGRICSAPCEIACVLNEEEAPIGIRALERYASDFGGTKGIAQADRARKNKKIAIVGSGPCGLTAAAELARKSYLVTMYETFDQAGGVLRYGIPEFRVPKKVLDGEINDIKRLGVNIVTNALIGQTLSIDDLKKDGFDAILLATGAGVPKFMDIKGSHLGGVYYGEEFLMRVNLTKLSTFGRAIPSFNIGPKVAVIGSGNTALDCARIAKRFQRDVTLIFRRTEDEMRVKSIERKFAREEGVRFEPLVKPLEIMGDVNQRVSGLKCARMDFAFEKENEEWALIPVDDSEFVLDVDTVIIAIGHNPNSLIQRKLSALKIHKDATVKLNPETRMTSIPDVFAAGNVVTNAGPIVNAIAAGKEIALDIDHHLNSKVSD